MRKMLVRRAGAGMAAAAAMLFAVGTAQAAVIHCGDVITTSVTFDNDVSGCDTLDAVTVSGTGITVNLNGHTVSGPGPLYGIHVDSSSSGVTVLAGRVTGFQTGVQIEGARTTVTLMEADGNGEAGIAVLAPRARVLANYANGNFDGISIGDGANHELAPDPLVKLNVVTGSTDAGIVMNQALRPRISANVVSRNGIGIGAFFASGGLIDGNTVIDNRGRGGFASGADGTTWSKNRILDNAGDGLFVKDTFADVIGNTVSGNGGNGILYSETTPFASRSRYGSNKANDNAGVGISVTAGTTDLGGNKAHRNGGGNCVNIACS